MTEKPEPQIITIPPGWLSSEDAAAALNVQAGVIRTLVKNGVLTRGYVGHSLYVTQESVDAYAASRGPRQGGRRKKTPDK